MDTSMEEKFSYQLLRRTDTLYFQVGASSGTVLPKPSELIRRKIVWHDKFDYRKPIYQNRNILAWIRYYMYKNRNTSLPYRKYQKHLKYNAETPIPKLLKIHNILKILNIQKISNILPRNLIHTNY